MPANKTNSATLNKTTFRFDEETGALLFLGSDLSGDLIRKGSGIVDIAWPVPLDYENLRLSADGKVRDGTKPEITVSENEITVFWQRLSSNTDMPHFDCMDGGVSALVTYRALEDGQSIAMSCKVTNHSETAVRQVLFPDFKGLLPIAGHEDTRFTTLGFSEAPFVTQADIPEKRHFFAEYLPVCGQFFRAGGYFSGNGMIGRWYDYGGLDGGVSVYRKCWGWGPENPDHMGLQEQTWVQFDNNEDTLRIAGVHSTRLEKGQTYESGDYIFTPHAGGWAEGIRPYESWVAQNKKRVVPLPEKIRDGLGFRTCWMQEGYPEDRDLINWRYHEIPDIARDAAEHGIYELNLWSALNSEYIPCDEKSLYEKTILAELGGSSEWFEALKQCEALGINVSAFVSWLSLYKKNAERYGVENQLRGADGGWTETRKAVPSFRPPYMQRYTCLEATSFDNALHRSDVETGLRLIRDKAGSPSISWDQVILNSNGILSNILREFRKETAEIYPDAVFSGESTYHFEDDIDYLDYTWDWLTWPGTGDARPYIRAVKTTRPNINVDCSPLHAKLCFMDNIFMNIFPSKPGGCNGSAMIADSPEFSRVLKRLAALRKDYLPYFTQGEMLGDCILFRPCKNARVTGYILENRVLIIAVKTDDMLSYIPYNAEWYLGGGPKRVLIRDLNGGLVYDWERYARDELTLGGASQDLFMIEILNP